MKTAKTKQFWSLLLALCMVLTLMPPAQAYFDDYEYSVELSLILAGETAENYLAPGDSVSVGDTIVVYPKQQDQYLDVSGFYYDWQIEQPDGMFKTVRASSWDTVGNNRLTVTEEMVGKSMRVYAYWDFEYPDTNMEIYSPQWSVDLPITEDYFPDSNFRDYVLTLPGAEDAVFTPSELNAIHTVSCAADFTLTEEERIHDMTGLTYFTALTGLRCEDQRLTELDLSQNTALTNLSCSLNELTSLDVSQNAELKELFCNGNALTELDLSQNPDLLVVSCQNNQLVELDLSMNAHVQAVDTEGNQRAAYEGMFLTELSTRLDPDRVSNVTGGSFENGVVHFTEETLTYSYDLGSGFQKTFTLIHSESSKGLAIDEENFPDEAFRAYVLTLPGAENGAFTDAELAAITSISFFGSTAPENEKIQDLTGIEHFTELTSLDCGNQLITDLDVRALPKLQGLYCHDNPLTELDVTRNPLLKTLVFAGTKIKEVDLSQNPDLNFLECSLTPLTALDVSGNKKLESLSCSESALTQIDLSQNAALITLGLDENQLTELDVSHNPALYALYCDANHLVELDLSQNPQLEVLNCGGNIREVAEGTLLSDLNPRFDVEKAAEVTGGSFDGGKVHFTEDALTYFYAVSADDFAQFTLVPDAEIPAPEFSDVDEDDWFYEPVQWAVKNGVTNGYTDGTFRPKNVCMRREVVTFLWNAEGKPEIPEDTKNPFKDVKDGQWYTTPILWAAQNGITAGKGAKDLFAPKDNVMRREFVAFLWRAKGCPEPTIALKDTPFQDVKDGQWYTKPILWAYENGITNGKGHADTFAPKDTCTRAEIVTFLSRAYAE